MNCACLLPPGPSGVASVLFRLFLRPQTPANFQQLVGWWGWWAAGGGGQGHCVIGKYILIQASRPFLFCSPFHARPNDNTTKVSLLPLQQLHSRYQLISLTFLKNTRAAPHPQEHPTSPGPVPQTIVHECSGGSPLSCNICSETVAEFSPNLLRTLMVSFQ